VNIWAAQNHDLWSRICLVGGEYEGDWIFLNRFYVAESSRLAEVDYFSEAVYNFTTMGSIKKNMIFLKKMMRNNGDDNLPHLKLLSQDLGCYSSP